MLARLHCWCTFAKAAWIGIAEEKREYAKADFQSVPGLQKCWDRLPLGHFDSCL